MGLKIRIRDGGSQVSSGATSSKKLLIGSPIRQAPPILKEFLNSLSELNVDGISVDCLFIDDNRELLSSSLLKSFQVVDQQVTILESHTAHISSYRRDEQTHHWDDAHVWRVAGFKNTIIEFARHNQYDYLWLIDSDLVLHPLTLQQLVAAGKDIVSNLFWTRWQPNTVEMPQVWLQDEYNLYVKKRGETVSKEEETRRIFEFMNQLRIPGVYEVGGLGACTLISARALEAGVNFKRIKNLSFWGEDRHFCVRAQALGFPLFVDTHHPAYHIYRDSELAGVSAYKAAFT